MTTNLFSLPEECLLHIIEHSDKKAYESWHLVSEKFNLLATDWQNSFAKAFGLPVVSSQKILKILFNIFPEIKQVNFFNVWETQSFLGCECRFARLDVKRDPTELISICIQSLKANETNPDEKKLREAILKQDLELVKVILDGINFRKPIYQEWFEDKRATLKRIDFNNLIHFVVQEATFEIGKAFFRHLPYAYFALPIAFQHRKLEIIDFLADQIDQQINDGTLDHTLVYQKKWNLGIQHLLLRGPVRPQPCNFLDEDDGTPLVCVLNLFGQDDNSTEAYDVRDFLPAATNISDDDTTPSISDDGELTDGVSDNEMDLSLNMMESKSSFGALIKAISSRTFIIDSPLSFIHRECLAIVNSEWGQRD